MPRTEHQIPLDYQTRVLPPKFVSLFFALLCHDKEFWCKEFEEVYLAFSGWERVWSLVTAAVDAGEAMRDGSTTDLRPEWWWLYLNFSVIPSYRYGYLNQVGPSSRADSFLRCEWVDLNLDELPSIHSAQAPALVFSGQGQSFTPASWMVCAGAEQQVLPSGAFEAPPAAFLACIGLFPAAPPPPPSRLLPVAPLSTLSSALAGCSRPPSIPQKKVNDFEQVVELMVTDRRSKPSKENSAAPSPEPRRPSYATSSSAGLTRRPNRILNLR
ncbi:hypothetical protein JCM10207_003536 [Rhodosporidiobolus poonsookiae]